MTDAQRALLRSHLEAERGHRLTDALAALADDCVFEDMALGRSFRGRAGASAYYRTWWDAFPDLTVELRSRHLAGDHVVAEVTFRGTHWGPFLGLPPTGRTIELPVAVVAALDSDRMVGERFYYDLTTLLRQLGARQVPALLDA